MSLSKFCVKPLNVANYYNCDEGHGAYLIDTCGSNDGAISAGIAWKQGKEAHRQCIDLTAEASITGIVLGDTTTLNSTAHFTIGVDIKVTEAGSVNKLIFDKKSSPYSATTRILIQHISDDNLRVRIAAGVTNTYGGFDTNFTLNTWGRLLIIYDGTLADNDTRLKVYYDGVAIAATAFTGTIPAATANMTGGTTQIAGNSAGFPCLFDNFTIWNVSLDTTDIANDFKKFNRKVRFKPYINFPRK